MIFGLLICLDLQKLFSIFFKCMWSEFFLQNFTLQYVNKFIVNVKVLQNKNLVMILMLKTAQFLAKIWQETGKSLLCNFILRQSVLDGTAFSESSNDKDTDVSEEEEVVYSQYTPYCIAIS